MYARITPDQIAFGRVNDALNGRMNEHRVKLHHPLHSLLRCSTADFIAMRSDNTLFDLKLCPIVCRVDAIVERAPSATLLRYIGNQREWMASLHQGTSDTFQLESGVPEAEVPESEVPKSNIYIQTTTERYRFTPSSQ